MITLERKHARKTLTERENHPQSTFIVVNFDSKVTGTYALTHKKKYVIFGAAMLQYKEVVEVCLRILLCSD